MEQGVLVYVLAVVVAGVAAQWVGWRLRVPAIVLLLAVGLLVGPGLRLIAPSEDLGPLLAAGIGLAVAVVVFEGGLNLNLAELEAAGRGIRRLVVLALPLNWVFGTLAAHWIGDLSWPVAALVGAILVVTGPTVILPLLRQANLRRRPATLLKWEAVVNDPLGAMLTVVVLQLVVETGDDDDLSTIALRLLPAVAVAVAAGAALALAVKAAFHADLVPEVLRVPVLTAGTLGLYAATNAVHAESGLLAATVFGLALANLSIAGLSHATRFEEAVTVMLVSALFILLAADIGREVFTWISWRLAAFVASVLLVVRPAAIWLATIGSGLCVRERLLVAWVAPRGIVAAAIAGLAGSELARAGFPEGRMVLPMVFAVIVATVVLQGMTLSPLARWLDLRAAERPGLLIVGASPWSLALARTLDGEGVPVAVADRSWAALRPVRDAGLRSAAIEVLSEAVSTSLDFAAVDYVLAATDDDAYNALVCARLAPELGQERVSQLAIAGRRLDSHAVPARDWRGKVVGGEGLDHATANALLAQGWRFQVRPVPTEADFGKARSAPEETVVLAIRPDGGLAFHSPEHRARLHAGDRLLTFRPPPPAPRSSPWAAGR